MKSVVTLKKLANISSCSVVGIRSPVSNLVSVAGCIPVFRDIAALQYPLSSLRILRFLISCILSMLDILSILYYFINIIYIQGWFFMAEFFVRFLGDDADHQCRIAADDYESAMQSACAFCDVLQVATLSKFVVYVSPVPFDD